MQSSSTSPENTQAHTKIMEYIEYHSAAVLGTTNDDGSPHGAVVYVCTEGDSQVFFLTKTETQKYQNLSAREQVSLTFFEEGSMTTLQASGRAYVVEDAATIDAVMRRLTRIASAASDWLPPISKLRAGSYTIVGIDLGHARLAEYGGEGIGSQHIFTEF